MDWPLLALRMCTTVGLLAVGSLHALVLGWVALRKRNRLRSLGSAGILAAFAYSPWFGGLTAHSKVGGLNWLRPPEYSDLLAIDAVVLPGLAILALGFLGALKATSSWCNPKKEADSKAFPPELLFLWFFVMVLGSYLKSLHGAAIFNPRNLLVVAPVAICLLAASAAHRGTRNDTIRVFLVCAGLLYGLVWEQDYYRAERKEQFREAASLADEWGGTEPDLSVISYSWSSKYFNYYFEQLGSDLRIFSNAGDPSNLSRQVARAFKKGATTVVVVAGHKTLGQRELSAMRRYSIKKRKNLLGAGVIQVEQR